jgi:hypothetical protein
MGWKKNATGTHITHKLSWEQKLQQGQEGGLEKAWGHNYAQIGNAQHGQAQGMFETSLEGLEDTTKVLTAQELSLTCADSEHNFSRTL